jgi:hypothetical protein
MAATEQKKASGEAAAHGGEDAQRSAAMEMLPAIAQGVRLGHARHARVAQGAAARRWLEALDRRDLRTARAMMAERGDSGLHLLGLTHQVVSEACATLREMWARPIAADARADAPAGAPLAWTEKTGAGRDAFVVRRELNAAAFSATAGAWLLLGFGQGAHDSARQRLAPGRAMAQDLANMLGEVAGEELAAEEMENAIWHERMQRRGEADPDEDPPAVRVESLAIFARAQENPWRDAWIALWQATEGEDPGPRASPEDLAWFFGRGLGRQGETLEAAMLLAKRQAFAAREAESLREAIGRPTMGSVGAETDFGPQERQTERSGGGKSLRL